MVVLAFAVVGVLVTLGFLGDYLFRKTGIPDILLLVVFGFLLGPFFRIIDPSVLSSIAPFLASLALLIILFDGGLNLSLNRVLRESPKAMLLGVLNVFISIVLTVLFTYYVWNWSVLYGLLLGTIIGGTSSSVVIPLISRLKVPPRILTLLSLESAFTDAMVIVVGIALLQWVEAFPAGNEFYTVAHGIASAFSIGAVLGLISGVVWLRILRVIQGGLYDDILTLSIVLLIFAVVEALGGNGAIFALTFGLVLGNGREISSMFQIKEPVEANRMMKRFISQLSFFIRTFFFMYLGLILVIKDYGLIIYSIILSLILLLGRTSSVFLISMGDTILEKNRGILCTMIPRGLAAVILAQFVLSSKVSNPSMFSDVVVIVIISTVVLASIGSSITEKKNQNIKGS